MMNYTTYFYNNYNGNKYFLMYPMTLYSIYAKWVINMISKSGRTVFYIYLSFIFDIIMHIGIGLLMSFKII